MRVMGKDVDFSDILLEKYESIFMTFRATLQQVQNHCVLGLMK